MRKILKFFCVIALSLALLAVWGCQSTAAPAETTAPSAVSDPPMTEPVKASLTVIAAGKTAYSVIRPDKCGNALKDAATAFNAQLAAQYDVRLQYGTDWDKAGGTVESDTPEILIGRTNRAESQAVAEKLEENSYAIAVMGAKIVICGYDEADTVRAITFFANTYLGGESLTLDASLEIVNRNPPVFLSSYPSARYCFLPEHAPRFTATFASETPIDFSRSSLLLDGADRTAEANWSEGQVSLELDSLGMGEHTVLLTVANAEGVNVLSRTFSCSDGSTMNLYRGEIHSHTDVSDGKGTTEQAYRYARDTAGMDFFAVTDHSYTYVKQAYLNEQIAIADSFNKPGKFVSIYGYEVTYFADSGYYGHMNVLNTTDFYENTLRITEVYDKVANTAQAVAQFNHPGYSWGTFCDFDYYTPERDAAVQLIEVWDAAQSSFYAQALAKGWHVSPVFNEDTHDATWTTKYPAVTYVLSPALTRENIVESMQRNRTYMTTDPTLKILYSANGQWMGSRLQAPDSLEIKVELSTEAVGGIGRISLLTEDGITVATVDAGAAKSYVWTLRVTPEYDYYYISTNNESGSYSVTAPIWIEARERIEIRALEQMLVTDVSAQAHAVKVSVANPSNKTLTDVSVDFYLSSEEGFDATVIAPFKTVHLGSLAPGAVSDATACADFDGPVRRVTAIVRGKQDGTTFADTAYTLLNSLYITEILPDPKLHGSATDAFAYIELYNNSNEPYDLSGHILRYWGAADGDHNGKLQTHVLSGVIPPHESMVIWFKTVFNRFTVEDFSAHYGKTFVEGENLIIAQGPKSTANVLSAKQTIQLDLIANGSVIIRAFYNWGDSLGEVVRGKAVSYAYPRIGVATAEKITATAAPTPGSVQADQIPKLITYAQLS